MTKPGYIVFAARSHLARWLCSAALYVMPRGPSRDLLSEYFADFTREIYVDVTMRGLAEHDFLVAACKHVWFQKDDTWFECRCGTIMAPMPGEVVEKQPDGSYVVSTRR